MADEPTTPPTDDDDASAAVAGSDATDETTKLPASEDAAAAPGPAATDASIEESAASPAGDAQHVPVAATPARSERWNPDRRSVVVTLVSVAVLAASFGLGWAAGAANGDDGERHIGSRMERFDHRGAPGAPGAPDGPGMRGGWGTERDGSDMRDERPGLAPGGGERGARPGGFDEGFDGPRSRNDDERGAGATAMRGGVVGTITKVDGDTLTIDAIGPKGSGSTTVEIDDDVDVVVRGGGDRASGSRDDLDEGAMIAAHGAGDAEADDDTIEADRIVVLRPAQ